MSNVDHSSAATVRLSEMYSVVSGNGTEYLVLEDGIVQGVVQALETVIDVKGGQP
ncbi:hypothetical protein GS454_24090 [Rhodococcus hoagii]|nr:hypothetical protein [Prescottella equi]MBM4596021.1 hypothetical protein [Prescottella equi]